MVYFASEQLIPMLGLVSLQHALNPHSTVEKAIFLIDNALTHSHVLTSIISFSALAILVVTRRLKGVFKNYWFIYRLPEVLLVVVFSTRVYPPPEIEASAANSRVSSVRRIRLGSGRCRYLGLCTHQYRRVLHSFTATQDNTSVSAADDFHSCVCFRHSFPLRLSPLMRAESLISVAGFLDSIVSAKQNAAKYGHSISPNRELVALGAGNLVASFVPGTLPAAGSITRCAALIMLSRIVELTWPQCVTNQQIKGKRRCRRKNANGFSRLLRRRAAGHVLPAPVAVLLTEMRARCYVRPI